MDRSRCQQTPKGPSAMVCGNQVPPEPIIRVRSLTTNLRHTKVHFFLRNTLKEDDPSECNIRVQLQTASRFSILCMFWNRRNSIVRCKENYVKWITQHWKKHEKTFCQGYSYIDKIPKKNKQCKDVNSDTNTIQNRVEIRVTCLLVQPAMYQTTFFHTQWIMTFISSLLV